MQTQQMSQALGQVAKSRIAKQESTRPTDREVSERTYLSIKQTIEKNDKWTQAEARDVLRFRDVNGIIWGLSIVNKHSRLYLILLNAGNGANLGWRSEPLLVGYPIEKDSGKIGFALTTDFSTFAQWRREVQRTRPATRPSPQSN